MRQGLSLPEVEFNAKRFKKFVERQQGLCGITLENSTYYTLTILLLLIFIFLVDYEYAIRYFFLNASNVL